MKYEVTPEDIALMCRMGAYANISNITAAIYRSPAESLRYQADRIEDRERDIRAFNTLITNLSEVIPQ